MSESPATTHTVQIAVIGGGPAGLTAALALGSAGINTALVAKRSEAADNRTTALMASSVAALARLGAWPFCAMHAAPLSAIRIIDATGRLLRAPEVLFAAHEIGLDAFGHNIENRHLVAALETALESAPSVTRIDDAALGVDLGPARATVRLGGGRALSAELIIGADGRRSMCRQAAGVATTAFSYPQTAVTLNLRHTRAHHGISTEFHTRAGPFTLVPLPGERSSLVWVVTPAEAERLAALPDSDLSAEVERGAHSILGRMEVEPGRGVFRLGVETARRFAANRVALIGEAAHVFPPIGAQGLNLGLRDAAIISELAVETIRQGGDAGAHEALMRYDRLRRADVTTRTLAVDILNRSLLSEFLPSQLMRGLGLYMLNRIAPLRRAVMREGVRPALSEPKLMRGEAL